MPLQPTPSPGPPQVSGTESESDAILTPPIDILPNTTSLSAIGTSGSFVPGTSPHPPLSSIIERRSGSGDESDEEDDGEEAGGWQPVDTKGKPRTSSDETVIKAGYLSKKGERRKVYTSSLYSAKVVLISFRRHGRSVGLCCGQHTWRTTKRTQSTSYSRSSIFRKSIHAHPFL